MIIKQFPQWPSGYGWALLLVSPSLTLPFKFRAKSLSPKTLQLAAITKSIFTIESMKVCLFNVIPSDINLITCLHYITAVFSPLQALA